MRHGAHPLTLLRCATEEQVSNFRIRIVFVNRLVGNLSYMAEQEIVYAVNVDTRRSLVARVGSLAVTLRRRRRRRPVSHLVLRYQYCCLLKARLMQA